MADQPALTKEQEAMGMTQPVAQVDVQNQPTVTFVQQPLVPITPEQFITDYRGMVVTITVIFAILGFPSLLFGIPACMYAYKSRTSVKEGNYVAAREQSLIAFYLAIGALCFGFFCFSAIVIIPIGTRFVD